MIDDTTVVLYNAAIYAEQSAEIKQFGAVLIEAQNPDEALKYAMEFCISQMPIQNGWVNHQVFLGQVPAFIIDRSFREMHKHAVNN